MNTAAPHAAFTLHGVRIPPSLRGPGLGGDAQALFDVDVANGQLAAVRPATPAPSNPTFSGGTLLPALVDLHLHLDKSHTVRDTGPANGDLFRAIDLIARHRATWTAADLRQRMGAALQEAWRHGTRALRTHLDWMEPGRPPSVDVLCALRVEWRGRLDIEWVSLTALDVFDDPAVAQNIAAQVREAGGILGCFVYRNPDLRPRLERVFELAAAHGLDLDFHVDEGLDAEADGLRHIAQISLQRRRTGQAVGRVTCGHACSLSVQPRAEAEVTLALLAEADTTLVTLPTTNLYLQGAWDQTPVPRGMTRVHEARRAGVRLCLATDNVADPFYPYGSYDLLESWALGVQVAHLAPAEDWLPCVTLAPAQAMGLPWDGRLGAGAPADFVWLQARDGLDLMNPAGRQRRVCRQGTWI